MTGKDCAGKKLCGDNIFCKILGKLACTVCKILKGTKCVIKYVVKKAVCIPCKVICVVTDKI